MDKVGRNPYRSVANADAVHLLCEFADRCGRLEISRRYAERQAGASHTYVPCRFRAVIDLDSAYCRGNEFDAVGANRLLLRRTGCCLGHNRLGARDIRLFYAATLG